MRVTIDVSTIDTLVDEDVSITVSGLKPNQRITLTSSMLDEKGEIFECFAFYKSNAEGRVKLSKDVSFGGMFEGVEPMGLFWAVQGSKQNKNKHLRLIKRNVEKPLNVEIHVHEKWKNIENLTDVKPMASTKIKRWYKSKGVKRIPIKQGQIRGTLFVPEGKGPFPTVVDMFGGGGGLHEFRASMLASRGYLTLSLAIFDYDDLPSTIEDVQLEYYEEAVEYLISHPQGNLSGVGIVGVSAGGSISLAMGAYLRGVKAIVCINAALYPERVFFKYRGYSMTPVPYDLSKMTFDGADEAIVGNQMRELPTEITKLPRNLMECHKSDCSYLLLASGDDGAFPMKIIAEDFIKLRNKFKLDEDKWRLKYYPGAGHLLELPNTPLCSTVYYKYMGCYLYYGGNKVDHAKAQSDSWKAILQFLSQQLTVSSKM